MLKQPGSYNDIVDEDEASYNEALTSFNTIDSSVYVDWVSAEHRETSHVNVIKDAKVHHVSDQRPHEFWDDHAS